MITKFFNNSFITHTGKNSFKKPQGEDFITHDVVTLSNGLSYSKDREEIYQKLISYGDNNIDLLIEEKKGDLRDAVKHLSSLNKYHRVLHELNTVPIQNLEDIHKEIDSMKIKIGKIKTEIRKLSLQKMDQEISSLPKEVIDYFTTVNFDITSDEINKIGNLYEKLKTTDSSVKIKGNNINTLEESELWQETNRLLDIKEGTPPLEIDLQYYLLGHPDIYNKLKNAAKHGHKVRVMIDTGAGFKPTGIYNTKDASDYFTCLKTLLSLEKETEGYNFGISVAKKEHLKDTMHRKFLRSGEKVLTGGMNCDTGSGENVDYGMVIEGPAAKVMTERFQEDVKNSAGKTMEELFGRELNILKTGFKIDGETGNQLKYNMVLPVSDFCDFLILLLPEESQKYIKNSGNITDKVIRILKEYKDAGLSIKDYGYFQDNGFNETAFSGNLMSNRDDLFVCLTDKGRVCLYKKLEESFKKINSEENLQYLKDITPPEGKESGNHTVTVGTTHEELQSIILYGINSAEEFLYIPGFCMSKDIVKLIINKKKSMKSKGKNFDVRVILEPDEIPPNNIESYLLLENAGIPVRWALLDGTGLTHNRKLHSKMMVSDKIILTGSTNLTHKGLRESWETSVLSFIDKGSEESISKREEYKKSFLDLWDKETLKLDLSYKNDTYPAVMSKEEYQRDLLKKTVRNIDRYERVFDGKVKDILDSREDVKEEVEKLKKDGLHEGNARLIALKKFYTEEEMKSLRISTGII